MKVILDYCKENNPHTWTIDCLKLRLRGNGSGYKEGLTQEESEEKLHLCISCKDPKIYMDAMSQVEKLLEKIY